MMMRTVGLMWQVNTKRMMVCHLVYLLKLRLTKWHHIIHKSQAAEMPMDLKMIKTKIMMWTNMEIVIMNHVMRINTMMVTATIMNHNMRFRRRMMQTNMAM